MNFEQEIRHYQPYNEQEKADQQVLLEYYKHIENLYDRNVLGHLCASLWIVNEDASKVLMVYHNIYDSWSWCGGHSDGEKDLCKKALEEGKEETGLKNIELLSNQIFSIEVLGVPSHRKKENFISAHIHLNITYLCKALESEDLCVKPDENQGVKWIPINEIDTYVQEKEMLPIYHKLIEKTNCFLKNKRTQ